MARSRVSQLLIGLGAGPLGPIRLALALSVPALPFVVWAVGHPSLPSNWSGSTKNELGDSLVLGTLAVIAGSVAGGYLGSRLMGRPTIAIFATVTIAWFAGVASLSIVSSLLGMDYIGAVFCTDGCQPLLSSLNPLSGAMAWGVGFAMSTMSIVPPLIALTLLTISRRFVRQRRPRGAAALAVTAAAVAQSWTFLGGGTAAIVVFLCLAVGVVVWASVIIPMPDPVGAPDVPATDVAAETRAASATAG